MPAPYSYDLRKKALSAVNRGERKKTVCSLLGISRNTLDLWLKREKETGNFSAITKSQKGREQKIKDWEKFKQVIQNNGEKTQKQIARLWGENLTQQNVSNAFKKLGITRKKKLMAIKSEIKKNAENFEKDC